MQTRDSVARSNDTKKLSGSPPPNDGPSSSTDNDEAQRNNKSKTISKEDKTNPQDNNKNSKKGPLAFSIASALRNATDYVVAIAEQHGDKQRETNAKRSNSSVHRKGRMTAPTLGSFSLGLGGIELQKRAQQRAKAKANKNAN